eukprot:Gb_27152 [translate_table: standard]
MMTVFYVPLKENTKDEVERLPVDSMKGPKEEMLDEEEESAISKIEPSLTFMVGEIKLKVFNGCIYLQEPLGMIFPIAARYKSLHLGATNLDCTRVVLEPDLVRNTKEWWCGEASLEITQEEYVGNKSYSSKREAFQRGRGRGDGTSNSRVKRANDTQSGQQRGRGFPMRGRGFGARGRGFATRGRGGRGACFRLPERQDEMVAIDKIFYRRIGKETRNKKYFEYLVRWKDNPIEEVVWMDEGEVIKLGVSLQDLKEWF